MTKNEKYIVEMYVRYFGKVPTDAQIAEYADLGKPKLILKQIMGDADDAKASMSTEDYVNSIFQNLFGRDASTKELNKYSKVVEKGKALPINSIVKSAKSSDKVVYNTKKAVAMLVAEEGSATNFDLDKITKDTYSEIYNPKTKKLLVDTVAQLETKVEAMQDNVTEQTFMLTASADTGVAFTGTEKGDVFNAYDFVTLDGTKIATLTGIDVLDGGAGKDTLNVVSDNAIEAVNATISNIEVINLQSAKDVEFDTTTFTGVETLNVTKAKNVDLTAAATTDVKVSGTTGTVEVDGGKNVTVTDAKAAVILDNAKGNVTVTDATQDSAISITDGANVTVTTTTATSNAAISVGHAVNGTATGDVVVTQNLNSDTDLTGGAITVVGGKTVTINVNSTNTDTTGAQTIITGAISVTGDANTTAVTVKQTEAATGAKLKIAEDAVKEVASVKFVALTVGQTVELDGLTFTAAKALTATEVAAAFANLTAGATHGDAKADNGIYSGVLANYNTGAVSTDTVVFTADKAGTIADLTNSGTNLADVITVTTQGDNGQEAQAAVGAIAQGVVEIEGDKIKTVVVDGYAGSSSISSDALTDVTLKNSDGTMAITSSASLNLTVNDVQDDVTLTGAKTLNLTTTGEASDFGLSAAAVETLTIAAGADLDITDSFASSTKIKTVTISGTADVTLGDIAVDTLETLTSTTTGNVSATVDGTKTTVTTGAGDDSITVDTTTVEKAITLGAGNDTLDLTAFTDLTGLAAISGGTGDDTIKLSSTTAATISADSDVNSGYTLFNSKVTGFEKLSLDNNIDANTSVNVGRLGFNYVITAADASNSLTLADMANNGTVELNAASSDDSIVVLVKDATAGLTDVLNVVLNSSNNNDDHGELTVDKVETINISTVELDSTNLDSATKLELIADSAKTVNVSGNADLTLNTTSDTITKVDAGTMTGKLVYIADGATAGTEVIGGAGNDTLIAYGDNDILKGGAGNDILVAGDFAKLTGGADADTFVAMTSTAKNSYATIMDFNKAEGDTIQFTGAKDFNNTKVTFENTISFEEYLDKAVVAAGNDGVSWFTYTDNLGSTNTYLVYNDEADVTPDTVFDIANDKVIKIAGVVDFSTAAFNEDNGSVGFINATTLEFNIA